MDVIQNDTIADLGEKTSSMKSSKLMIQLNDKPTKCEFVDVCDVLKGIGDYQLFSRFFESQRMRLKTKGLQGQFLKMDVCKFYTLMKIKLNNHSDWDKWLVRLCNCTSHSQ